MTTTDEPTPIDITPNQDGGVLKSIIREGEGDERPFPGDKVIVHYVGTLLDGTQFDSSRDRAEKFTFDVGRGSVIKGWDLGVPTMRRGELATFTIRSDYGYGDLGSPPSIPGKATLVFEIELFDFHGEDLSEAKDKSLVRRVLKAGSGYTSPNDGARVVVNLKGYDSAGRVFDERTGVEFEVGESNELNICPGVEKALLKFKKDEHSRLYLKSHVAWGSAGCSVLQVEPNTDVVYEVALTSFEKCKESWQLNGGEKLEQAELFKNKGTEHFKKGEYAQALRKYNKILDYLEHEVYDTEERKSKSKALQLAARLNIQMCHLKTREYMLAIQACEKALELDPRNEKSLFRKGQAYQGQCEFNDAIRCYNQVLEVNPENKDAANSVALCHQKIKEFNQKEKQMYGKMFSALSK